MIAQIIQSGLLKFKNGNSLISSMLSGTIGESMSCFLCSILFVSGVVTDDEPGSAGETCKKENRFICNFL